MRLIILLIILGCFFNSTYSQSSQLISFAHKDHPDLIKGWEFYAFDNLKIADSTFERSARIVNSFFNIDSLLNESPTKIVWFKKRIKTDSTFYLQDVTFNLELVGAAEIYINNKKIKSFGNISGFELRDVLKTDDLSFSVALDADKNYDIAIRFSNNCLTEIRENNYENSIGFGLKYTKTDTFIQNFITSIIPSFVLITILAMFFFTLSFVHFILYLFYRKDNANFLYSLFCFAFALSLISLSVSGNVFNLQQLSFFEKMNYAIPSFVLMLMPYMLSSFFKFKKEKWYFVFILLCGISILNIFIAIPYMSFVIISFAISSGILTLYLLYKAIKQKIDGAKYIAIGIGIFFLFIISLVIVAFSFGNIQTGNTTIGIVIFILLLLCIISIPVSITVFLATQISRTNISLSKKLVEVEELSVKSLEQEKEKQRYLENQKQVLEEQVIERTVEITEQKQIIVDKNKDIIDSINYAKRIQTSILPTVDYFNKVFSKAFIFFQPRDIVSGDFYYVTEVNNSKLLFCADCTGHGVPGALMSMVGSNLIHKIIHEHKIFEPKLILETLHHELRSSLKQDVLGSDNRDGMDACIVIVNDAELIYAGANRPLFYFDSENNLHEIKATKTPIGGSHIESVNISQHTVNKESIKEFYVFSDGFADQFGGPNGKKLMVSRFKQWLNDIQNLNSIEKKDFIEKEFIKWKNNLEQVDDVMVIGVTLK